VKASSVRSRSSRRVAAAALIGLGAVTALAGCGFETRQQGAAVVNGHVIHEDQLQETTRQLRTLEEFKGVPESAIVEALVTQRLLEPALQKRGVWEPDQTYATLIARIPGATEMTKDLVEFIALSQSKAVTQADIDALQQEVKAANVTVNPRFGTFTRIDQSPFFTVDQKQPNWITVPAAATPAPNPTK